jgi:hypothetical protein
MILRHQTYFAHSGSTMVEAVMAIGVLAVALPMMLSVLISSGDSAHATAAEICSLWIVPACMQEVRSSRDGGGEYIQATQRGSVFPPNGQPVMFGFADDGTLIGELDAAAYDAGVHELNGVNVRYVARLTGEVIDRAVDEQLLVNIDIQCEYPAIQPAKYRRKIPFHACIR